MPLPRAMLFDLDETILDRAAAIRSFARAQRLRFAAPLAPVRDQYEACLLDADAHGYADRRACYTQVVEALALPSALADRLVADFWSHFPDHSVPTPGALDTCRALRERGVPLALVTNGGSRTQRRKIEVLGIGPLFQTILVSGEVGFAKPDKRLFELALESLGTWAAETVHVGDRLLDDVEGAARAGVTPVWRRPPWHAPLPEPPCSVIETLPELLTD